MFILAPDFFFPYRIQQQQRKGRGKNFWYPTFFVAIFTKSGNNFILNWNKKKMESVDRIKVFLPKGLWIQGLKKNRIPDPNPQH